MSPFGDIVPLSCLGSDGCSGMKDDSRHSPLPVGGGDRKEQPHLIQLVLGQVFMELSVFVVCCGSWLAHVGKGRRKPLASLAGGTQDTTGRGE